MVRRKEQGIVEAPAAQPANTLTPAEQSQQQPKRADLPSSMHIQAPTIHHVAP
jgi:hypothetical protein